jgi:hypothetical protein
MTLPISASQVTRTIGMSHQHPALCWDKNVPNPFFPFQKHIFMQKLNLTCIDIRFGKGKNFSKFLIFIFKHGYYFLFHIYYFIFAMYNTITLNCFEQLRAKYHPCSLLLGKIRVIIYWEFSMCQSLLQKLYVLSCLILKNIRKYNNHYLPSIFEIKAWNSWLTCPESHSFYWWRHYPNLKDWIPVPMPSTTLSSSNPLIIF